MGFSKDFAVKPGQKVDLSKWDASCTGGLASKKAAGKELRKNHDRLAELQYLLYAENKQSLLIVLQAMDAGGKDGTIRHVMGPMNPQSCRVTSFKAPSEEEMAHDFLWRVHKVAPRKGEIVIFNRSQYEDVLIVRVRGMVPKKVWQRRFDRINEFERLLTGSGTCVLKFFLHISHEEQLKRLRERLKDPSKHWKANPQDFEEREYWDEYQKAYEDVLSRCSTPDAPWYVIPANRKWFRNLAVSEIVVEAMEGLKMKFPKPAFDVTKIKVE
jgi:PPK2 family polyphosphate:nucleotide phosphotransferase